MLNEHSFSISSDVRDVYPTISVGVAVIEGVTVTPSPPQLKKQMSELVEQLASLSNEDIGTFPEIQSYRKLYKSMGVDWHSRRPSPEALLRRISKGKGLYSINSCVDAYNCVVLKDRISIGAFDLDSLTPPLSVRFPKKQTETIHLLGDEEETVYRPDELMYADMHGGYNIDFNYRDAKRTAVTTKTRNLLLNVDGIFDISPNMVSDTLNKTIDMLQKYCGGMLTFHRLYTP